MSAGRGYLRYTCTCTCTCTSGIPVSIQTGVPVYLFVPVGTCLYLFGNRLVPVGTCFPALCISGLVVDTLILSLRSLRCKSKVRTLDCYQPQKIKPVFYKNRYTCFNSGPVPVYLFHIRYNRYRFTNQYSVIPTLSATVTGIRYTCTCRNRYPVWTTMYLSHRILGSEPRKSIR